MQKQSFGSVEVTWLDRDAVLAAVQRAARRLVRQHQEISRIILFGSMARGDAVPGSDVDLLIVLTHHEKRFIERIPEYHPTGVPVGVDVFPYTEEELTTMQGDRNPFLRQALAEGVEVYRRAKEK